MADLIEPLLVTPGSTAELGWDFDPGYTGSVEQAQAKVLLAWSVRFLAD